MLPAIYTQSYCLYIHACCQLIPSMKFESKLNHIALLGLWAQPKDSIRLFVHTYVCSYKLGHGHMQHAFMILCIITRMTVQYIAAFLTATARKRACWFSTALLVLADRTYMSKSTPFLALLRMFSITTSSATKDDTCLLHRNVHRKSLKQRLRTSFDWKLQLILGEVIYIHRIIHSIHVHHLPTGSMSLRFKP